MYRDLRSVKFDVTPGLSGTDGCYLKTTLIENGIKRYYKLSTYDEVRGFIGYESFNEVIAARVLGILGIEVVEQHLVKVLVRMNGVDICTYACVSDSYKRKGESRITCRDLYSQNKKGKESPHETLRRIGFEDFVNRIFVADYLIIGRDRHDSNLEFLKGKKGIRSAPLFDNGISFLAPILGGIPEELFKRNVLAFRELDDYSANNYLGYRSLFANLNLVTKPIGVYKLVLEDKKKIFHGMNSILPKYYIDKIWSIICYRYSFLRKVGIIYELDKPQRTTR